MKKFLIIQTAFIGDVVLATGLVEKLHQYYPDAILDILVRKGNEALLKRHPFLNKVLVWDKKNNKYKNLWGILQEIRNAKYDYVINLQRFAASGLLTAFSGAKTTTGFKKNPFSLFFSKRFTHLIGKKGDTSFYHETERNHLLIQEFTDRVAAKPKLYPDEADFNFVYEYKTRPYLTISPASVWYTKQYPKEKWIVFLNQVNIDVYLLGGAGDNQLCEEIRLETGSNVLNLAGKLNFLQSAALMKDARMNYANDSAPLHFASSMNAPVAAIFCSTIIEFGFGPLSDKKFIIDDQKYLACRPCGLHGFQECPQKHFNCAKDIDTVQLLNALIGSV